MPYGIRETRDGYALYNRVTGRVLGKHPTRAQAEAQRRAVMAAEHGRRRKSPRRHK